MPDAPVLLTVSEAARRTGLSADTIRRYSDAGLLPVQWTPTKQRRFRPQDIDALLSERRPA